MTKMYAFKHWKKVNIHELNQNVHFGYFTVASVGVDL